MNVVIQSPSSTLSFGNTEVNGSFASLSTVGTAVTTAGLKTPGAILLDGNTDVSKKGVVRAVVRVRVPLWDLLKASEGSSAATTGSMVAVGGKIPAGYAQVALTVTLPNTAGIIAGASDVDATTGIPLNQAAANATAVAMAMQILLNEVCRQGAAASPVLVNGGSLMDYTLLGSDVNNNPIARGLMGLKPVSDSDRGIAAAAS